MSDRNSTRTFVKWLNADNFSVRREVLVNQTAPRESSPLSNKHLKDLGFQGAHIWPLHWGGPEVQQRFNAHSTVNQSRQTRVENAIVRLTEKANKAGIRIFVTADAWRYPEVLNLFQEQTYKIESVTPDGKSQVLAEVTINQNLSKKQRTALAQKKNIVINPRSIVTLEGNIADVDRKLSALLEGLQKKHQRKAPSSTKPTNAQRATKKSQKGIPPKPKVDAAASEQEEAIRKEERKKERKKRKAAKKARKAAAKKEKSGNSVNPEVSQSEEVDLEKEKRKKKRKAVKAKRKNAKAAKKARKEAAKKEKIEAQQKKKKKHRGKKSAGKKKNVETKNTKIESTKEKKAEPKKDQKAIRAKRKRAKAAKKARKEAAKREQIEADRKKKVTRRQRETQRATKPPPMSEKARGIAARGTTFRRIPISGVRAKAGAAVLAELGGKVLANRAAKAQKEKVAREKKKMMPLVEQYLASGRIATLTRIAEVPTAEKADFDAKYLHDAPEIFICWTIDSFKDSSELNGKREVQADKVGRLKYIKKSKSNQPSPCRQAQKGYELKYYDREVFYPTASDYSGSISGVFRPVKIMNLKSDANDEKFLNRTLTFSSISTIDPFKLVMTAQAKPGNATLYLKNFKLSNGGRNLNSKRLSVRAFSLPDIPVINIQLSARKKTNHQYRFEVEMEGTSVNYNYNLKSTFDYLHSEDDNKPAFLLEYCYDENYTLLKILWVQQRGQTNPVASPPLTLKEKLKLMKLVKRKLK